MTEELCEFLPSARLGHEPSSLLSPLTPLSLPLSPPVKLITEDTVFAGTGTDEVFSCRSRLMDGGVYVAPVNLPFHKDP